MSKYKYRARDKEAKLVEGEVEALSAQAAARDLSDKGYIPLKIEKEASWFSLPAVIFLKPGRLKIRELMVFFRQMSVLVAAGVPLIESLSSVEEQVSNKRFKLAIGEIGKDIESGLALSQSFAKHSDIFSELIVAMVEAGEKGGVIDEVLSKIAAYLEKETKLKQRIQSALRYPLSVLIALSAAFIVVVTFVIPRFGKVFAALGGNLPLPTRVLLGINFAVVHYWWLILAVSGLVYYLFRLYVGSAAGRRQWDQLLLRVPVFGELLTKISLARFFSMLSAMLSSGITIVYGLEVTAATADNVIISDAVFKLREKVIGGRGLSSPMRENKIFPSISVQMVAIGEQSGSLDKMLLKNADYFDEEADYMISNLMTLLEPFLILFLGLLVLLLALGVFLPMWSMMQLYTQ